MEGKDGSLAEGRPHDLEVARLQLSLNVIEADADEESKINAQLAHLICLRLDSARKAAERLLGILQVAVLFILLFSTYFKLICFKATNSKPSACLIGPDFEYGQNSLKGTSSHGEFT